MRNTQLALLLIPLLLVDLVLIAVALVDWARRSRYRHLTRWVWLLVIVLLSTLGPILYLTLGRAEDQESADDSHQM